ncbi:MAG: hypothetical protein RL215_1124, partial [Planctomycetota bacterium]
LDPAANPGHLMAGELGVGERRSVQSLNRRPAVDEEDSRATSWSASSLAAEADVPLPWDFGQGRGEADLAELAALLRLIDRVGDRAPLALTPAVRARGVSAKNAALQPASAQDGGLNPPISHSELQLLDDLFGLPLGFPE